MSLINVTNLTFGYEGSYDTIFENTSFQLDTDWRLGFTGRNGRGKTTFLRLLMGQLAYSGTITSSVTFEYFPYPVPDPTQTTQQVVEEMGGGWMQWELERELSQLEVDAGALERPFGTLSSGEQTKVLLAALFLRENSFLLIDEPTNHLDAEARGLVSRYLRTKSGFILVSHDRRFLDDCVDHILAINRTDIEVQRGNFTSWWENKRQRDQWELAENQRLKSDIKRLTTAARKTADWSDKIEKSKIGEHCGDRGFVGHRAAKMMQRSKNLETRQQSAITEKSALLHNLEEVESLRLTPLPYPKKRLLEVRDLTIAYGERPVLSGVTFSVERGERLLLRGRNGSGKSSLLKLILGQEIPHTGAVELGSNLKLSYVSQETEFLRGQLDDYAEAQGVDRTLFLAILRKLDFSRTQFEKPMEDYSGGQKKKVLLAASLSTRANLYLWDEPLNFVDVFSRMQLETLLLGSSATMIFVEHDALFAERVATRVLAL